jgi:NAD(P)-dependent dehydrogenase (short-subunit alcohol dehydrogenase family)
MQGQVAVVTGAASGIGAAIAERFIEEGARCVLVDIHDDAGRDVAARHGSSASYVHGDVSVEDDVEAMVDAAVERFGRLDCVVNNAGILGAIGPIAEIDGAAWRRSVAVLLDSVFYGTKHAARVLIEQGSGGAIVNIASTAGVKAGLGPHVYTAAKHGVVGLTQSVAPELGRHGIRVNAIAPGSTVTSLTAYVTTGDASDLGEASRRVGRGSDDRSSRRPARHRRRGTLPRLGRGGLYQRGRPRRRRRERGDRRQEPAIRRHGRDDRAGGRADRAVSFLN